VLTSISGKAGTLYLSWLGGHIASVSDDSGRAVHYSYIGSDLVSSTNPDGDSFTYSYDGAHHLSAITDFNGVTYLENLYDGQGRVIEQYQIEQGRTYFHYDDTARTNTCTTDTGLSSTITYDADWRITSETNNDGTVSYTYDGQNRMSSFTDRLGRTYY
jgi:YD repeat-containing protein